MRAAEASAPLADDELEALFAPVAGASGLALAVSGGADSLALLDAADRWRRTEGRPGVLVLTVDHGLREGSAEEAAMVVAVAEGRGLAARPLAVSAPLPESDTEAAARKARYRLLIGAARDAGASHLLLAHHRDDQAETFLMRLERGSGVFGLAAMRRMVDSDGLAVFRPFLDLPRSRLVATTAAAGLVPVDDPMNRDPRFLRARVRRLMPALAEAGIGAEGLAATAARFATAADAIDALVDRVIGAAATVDDLGIVAIPLAAFRDEPEEVRLRLLARVLMAVGGEPYPPRFQRLKALHDGLIGHAGARLKRSLAGVLVEIRKGRALLYREFGRAGLPEIPLDPGFRGTWDHRFRVEIGANAAPRLVLGPLGEAGRQAFSGPRIDAPAAALAVQPAIWRDGKVLAAPTLGPAAGEALDVPVAVRQIVGERLAAPPRFPRFAES